MPGKWTKLKAKPPFAANTMLLLTDGDVFAYAMWPTDWRWGGGQWWRLTPDAFGNYSNGHWTKTRQMDYGPLDFASAVLADGRVIVAGGEYDGISQVEADEAELYDPVADQWLRLGTPSWGEIGDAPCCVLPDGRLFVGWIDGYKTAIYDPMVNTWNSAAQKLNGRSSEETWVLMPEGTVLTVNCDPPGTAEKYLAKTDQWVQAGSPANPLVEASSLEIGPALLLPDGRAFFVGATKHTGLYTAGPAPTDPGSWAPGPDIPAVGGQTIGAKDAPGVLLPNGRVLFAAGPVDGQKDNYFGPTYFFEFDPVRETIEHIPAPPNANPPFMCRLLLLPTGQVLYSSSVDLIWVYTPPGSPFSTWRPTIQTCPSVLLPGHTYQLTGRQLNGLSQANSFGDDAACATNYPLVKLTFDRTGYVRYLRTHDHSTMAVATEKAIHSTSFDVPSAIAQGRARLTVVANGIESAPVEVLVKRFATPSYPKPLFKGPKKVRFPGPPWEAAREPHARKTAKKKSTAKPTKKRPKSSSGP